MESDISPNSFKASEFGILFGHKVFNTPLSQHFERLELQMCTAHLITIHNSGGLKVCLLGLRMTSFLAMRLLLVLPLILPLVLLLLFVLLLLLSVLLLLLLVVLLLLMGLLPLLLLQLPLMLLQLLGGVIPSA